MNPRPDSERFEPVATGSPLDTLIRQHRAETSLDVRALAKDLEFAIDVTEPRDVLIARFEECIRAAIKQAEGREP